VPRGAGYSSRWEESPLSSRALSVLPIPLDPGVPGATRRAATPRPAAEIVGVGGGAAALDGVARVETEQGEDVTDCFLRGAREVLRVARLVGAGSAVLKARSPSCGVGFTYDGSFSHTVCSGSGRGRPPRTRGTDSIHGGELRLSTEGGLGRRQPCLSVSRRRAGLRRRRPRTRWGRDVRGARGYSHRAAGSHVAPCEWPPA